MLFVFTFGAGHKPYSDGYTLVEAPNAPEARKLMMEACGTHWSGQYNSVEESEVVKYGCQFYDFEEVKKNPPKSAHDVQDEIDSNPALDLATFGTSLTEDEVDYDVQQIHKGESTPSGKPITP